MPNANIHALRIGKYTCSFREAPLSLTTLAALIPPELNCTVKIIDESVEDINFSEISKFDLVGISVITGTSIRAYEIADRIRKLQVPVVLGGIHVSIFPGEAKKHADSIVIGYAEKIWSQVLYDFKNNRLKEKYNSKTQYEIKKLPHARRELQRKFRYMMPNTVMASRGCMHTCDFCTIPVVSKGYHTRPIEDIIAEIRTLKGKRFAFNDVSINEDLNYTKTLLRALIPLKKHWGGLATIKITKDPEAMKLLEQSGCKYLLIGFESFSQNTLTNIYKGFNKVSDYKEAMKKFHDAGIMIQGCFVFGFDQDDKTIFEETVEQVNRLKIDIPRYAIYTPYPKTKLFNRLEEEGRILTYDWSKYDTQHVVYKPMKMTPVELYDGFRWAFRETFKVNSITKRTLRSNRNFPITFIGNLAYKLYIKRLYQEPLPSFSIKPQLRELEA